MKDGKILCAVCGLGACGSAIAEAFQKTEIGTAFIANSSAEDLKSIKGIDEANKCQFYSIQGTGKNRLKAAEAFKTEYERFLKHFDSRLVKPGKEGEKGIEKDDYDIIFVPVGAGGGTGSGIMPIVARMLKVAYSKARIIPIIALPSMYERGIAQQNALDCLREIVDEKFTMIVVDNSRIEQDLLESKYDAINMTIATNLYKFLYYDKVSRISNIDVVDRLSLFGDPGILEICSAEVGEKEASPILTGIKKAIDASPMISDITSGVRRVAIQCECKNELYLKNNILEAQGYFKNTGGIFEGFYEPMKKGGGEVNGILVAFSGAKMAEQNIRDREAAIEEQYKAMAASETQIAKGSGELKDAWHNKHDNEHVEEGGKFDMASIFESVAQKRT